MGIKVSAREEQNFSTFCLLRGVTYQLRINSALFTYLPGGVSSILVGGVCAIHNYVSYFVGIQQLQQLPLVIVDLSSTRRFRYVHHRLAAHYGLYDDLLVVTGGRIRKRGRRALVCTQGTI